MEKLVKSFLFTSLVHSLKCQENNLGNKKLIMMSIMTMHSRFFDGYFRDTTVIRPIQILQLQLKLVTLLRQPLYDLVHLVNLGLIINCGAFECRYLIFKLINLLLRQVLLLFKLLAK